MDSTIIKPKEFEDYLNEKFTPEEIKSMSTERLETLKKEFYKPIVDLFEMLLEWDMEQNGL